MWGCPRGGLYLAGRGRRDLVASGGLGCQQAVGADGALRTNEVDGAPR